LLPTEQIKVLSQTPNIESFSAKVKTVQETPLTATEIEIFQINVGYLCNMTCKHCHVEAGPTRTELMSKENLQRCLDLIAKSNVSTVDLTGGAPEMNPHLAWFIEEASKLNRRIIVRSNLTVLRLPKYAHFIDLFVRCKVEVVASVPSYEESKTDQQRGDQTFKRSIGVLKTLNEKGYGKPGSDLVLNLVHNPVGAYLPGDQESLEAEYKNQLGKNHDIVFNQLYCITNLPIARYLEYLLETENYEDYMTDLVNAFNPAAVENVMCRNTISVGWDGTLYDCDFNQMLKLPITFGAPRTLADFDFDKLKGRKIVVNNHCYGCTAGAGSSCQGSLE